MGKIIDKIEKKERVVEPIWPTRVPLNSLQEVREGQKQKD